MFLFIKKTIKCSNSVNFWCRQKVYFSPSTKHKSLKKSSSSLKEEKLDQEKHGLTQTHLEGRRTTDLKCIRHLRTLSLSSIPCLSLSVSLCSILCLSFSLCLTHTHTHKRVRTKSYNSEDSSQSGEEGEGVLKCSCMFFLAWIIS